MRESPDGDRWNLLYLETFGDSTVSLSRHADAMLYEVRGDGGHPFLDRTLHYEQAVSWLRRVLELHGRLEFRSMKNAMAAEKLGLPPLSDPRVFYHV